MLEKFFKLRNEWKQSYPKKAIGGASALAGFDYQLGVFLLKLLEKWIKAYQKKEPLSPPSTFVEAISDITDLSTDGLLYVTQVKLTSPTSDNKVFKVFDEFWDIFNLARSVIPGSESDLRFILCASDRPVPDLHKKYQRWIEKKSQPQLLASQLGSLISTKRITEPHDRILSLRA